MAAFVVRMRFSRSLWPFILVLLIVGSRILSFWNVPGAYSIYICFMVLLFVFAGGALILKSPHILNTQAQVFFILSLPIMLLQIAGSAESLQIFNTLYAFVDPSGGMIQPEFKLLPLLFTPDIVLRSENSADFFKYLSMQSRPPGITHSSAMFAVFILAGSAVYIGQLNDRRLRLTDFIFVAVVVFSGSKLSLLCFTLIIFLSFLRNKRIIRTRLLYILCLLIMMLWIYYLTFPASMEHNYYMGAFVVSFATRFVDAALMIFPSLSSSSYFLDIIHTYPTLLMNVTVERGSLSGIYQLFQFLPYALLVLIVVLPKVRKGFRICMEANPSIANISKLMLLVILIIPFATNIFTSPFYGICVGVAIAPLILGISQRINNYDTK
ncbi:hypothetical protein OAI21_01535 [Oceanospirillaceae bacterium]|nr:hypothetical protein [Oceanospirillaceae bacterium]